MVAETFVTLGAWTGLGWILDDERALACPDRPLARSWIFQPGVEPARSALFRPNGVVLARSPVLQHLSRLLHRGLSSAPSLATGPIRRPPAPGNARMIGLCAV